MYLSKYFTLEELVRTDYGETYIKANKQFALQENNLEKLKKLCNYADKIRDYIGKPITVSSGVRSEKLNSVIPNASKTSQHCKCEAMDLKMSKQDIKKVFLAIYNGDIPELKNAFYQIIVETNRTSWLHIGIKRNPNEQTEFMLWSPKNGYLNYIGNEDKLDVILNL